MREREREREDMRREEILKHIYAQIINFVVVFVVSVKIPLYIFHVIPVDPFSTFGRESHCNNILGDDFEKKEKEKEMREKKEGEKKK